MSEPAQSHPDEIVLHEYLDGALTPALHAEVESHLAGCPTCIASLLELQALFSALGSLADVPLERDLSPAVIAAIRPTRIDEDQTTANATPLRYVADYEPANATPLRYVADYEPVPPALRWAVGVQLAAAVALLIFAWPWVAGRFAGLAVGPLRAQIVAGALSTWRLLAAWWPTQMTWVRGLGVPSLNVTRYAPTLQLSPLSWWALIAAALLLWLAGNGLLLRLFRGGPNGHS